MNYESFGKFLIFIGFISFFLLTFVSFSVEPTYSQKSDTLDKEELKEFVQKEVEKTKKEIREYTESNIKSTESWISFAKMVATVLGVLIALVFGFQIVKSIQMDREYNRIIEIRKDAQKIVDKTTEDLDNIKKLLSSLVESSVKEYANVIKDLLKGEISKEFIKPLQEEAIKKAEIIDKLKNVEAQIQLLEKLKANVTPDTYVDKGLILFRQGVISNAIKSYQMALEIDPGYKRAILNLTEAYILNKQYNIAAGFATEKSKFVIKAEDQIILKQLLVTARCLANQDYSKELTVLLHLLRENRDFDSGSWRWGFTEMKEFLRKSDIEQKKKNFLFRLINLLRKEISIEEFESELELGV